MNTKDYVEKSVHLDVASGSQTTDDVASLVVLPGYPEPATTSGVTVIAARRGHDDNGIDWALDSLREHIERVIGYVVNDCICVVQQQGAVPEESRNVIAQALRDNFDT
jgi:hypothetical protein